MSHANYVENTKTVKQKMGHLVEEVGEVLAAAGKSLRWGLDSWNPELMTEEMEGEGEKPETNREWLLRELADLRLSIDRLEEAIK